MLTIDSSPAYLGSLVASKVASSPVQVCIHGHFYQPPRENPFTGQIPREIGAEPYANFNEKINAECYRPNALAGNFERMSFNLGPTLAAWVEQHDPETYRLIIESDRRNYERFGYGTALAQNYNHVILPLAKPADARLQIEWGVQDFERRFGHKPEGMWLAETGASTWVLDMLAQAGLKFVILAPWQADVSSVETIDPARRALLQSRLRQHIIDQWHAEADRTHAEKGLADSSLPESDLMNLVAARLPLLPPRLPEPYDVSEAYLVELAEGRSIVAFFYNGKLSGDISFSQEATADADRYAQEWLLPEVNPAKLEAHQPQLLLIATDGELYGHHQPYRDHFLQYLTTFAIKDNGMTLTFPSRYLRENPPGRRIQIHDNSSWSCHHGVERWSRGCYCTPGDSSWKGILRQACDLLSVEVDRLYAEFAPLLLRDPDKALREFLPVWQQVQPVETFMQTHLQEGQASQRDLAVRLLRSQFYKHQMYTSCAWFFEDIDRIEPKNALAAAAIIFRLLHRRLPADLRQRFEQTLTQARSQQTGLDGSQLYRRGLQWAAKNGLLARTDPTTDPAPLLKPTELPSPSDPSEEAVA